MEGLGVFVDGPWEVRKAVRQMVKDGADMIKMYITGEGLLLECQQTELTCTQEEIDVMVEEAHRRNRLVLGARHARPRAARWPRAPASISSTTPPSSTTRRLT